MTEQRKFLRTDGIYNTACYFIGHSAYPWVGYLGLAEDDKTDLVILNSWLQGYCHTVASELV